MIKQCYYDTYKNSHNLNLFTRTSIHRTRLMPASIKSTFLEKTPHETSQSYAAFRNLSSSLRLLSASLSSLVFSIFIRIFFPETTLRLT
eukprot:c24275_g2_i4 orf=467-733(+)